MANVNIDDLGAASTLANADLFEVLQGGVNKKATALQVKTFVGAGGGTVTTFSAGDLSPLFTTNVTNATTTPALTFTLSNQNANLVFAGPSMGAAAAPTFRALVVDDLPAGTIQDLQSVLNQGATANITGPLAVISDDTVTFEGTSVGLSSATAGLNVATTVTIAAGGIAYPWPTSAPGANGYALISQTDGTLSWGGVLTSTLASANFLVGNGSNVATAVAMSGEATLANTGAVTLSNAAVIAKVLTGYTSGAGTVAATDSILQAIQKLDGNDALNWKLTGTSTLTGTTTIANGGNNLTFSGAGIHAFSSTSATNAGNFTVGGSYTVPAGAAVNSYLQVFNGTITSKGTANDSIIGTRFNHTLTNSTGGAVAHICVRIDGTATGSTTPATAVALQVLGMTSSATANEIIRGISNLGINRWQLRNDGTQVWTSTTTGSDLGGSMATNATNGSGHLLMSFSVAGSVTTAHTHFGLKATGGLTTNATNNTYYSFWDNRALVVNNTGFIGYGFSYQPVVTGTQSGTETLYAFTSNAGLWGVGTLTPTALLHVSASTTARASLRIESGTAPASPNNGDIWFDGTDIKMRVGGVTKTFTLV